MQKVVIVDKSYCVHKFRKKSELIDLSTDPLALFYDECPKLEL